MKPEPRIETIEEAKAALDERIAIAEDSVSYRQRAYDSAKAELDSANSVVWALRAIRRRMDPLPVEVAEAAADQIEAA